MVSTWRRRPRAAWPRQWRCAQREWASQFQKDFAKTQLHLQARGAHVEDALGKHVADFVPGEVAAPHAL
jgi:hypothetical protein